MTEKTFFEKSIEPNETQIRAKLKSAYPVLLDVRKTIKNIVGETIKE